MAREMDIAGKTAIMFIVADPIAHVLGTAVLNARFRRSGQDIVACPPHVRPEDLEAPNWSGRSISCGASPTAG